METVPMSKSHVQRLEAQGAPYLNPSRGGASGGWAVHTWRHEVLHFAATLSLSTAARFQAVEAGAYP